MKNENVTGFLQLNVHTNNAECQVLPAIEFSFNNLLTLTAFLQKCASEQPQVFFFLWKNYFLFENVEQTWNSKGQKLYL